MMGLWLLVAALLVFQGSASYRGPDGGRKRRQLDHWWRAHQSVSGIGSSRREGWGNTGWTSHSRSPGAEYVWGSSRMSFGEAGGPRQQVASNPVSVMCNEDTMVVTVQRDLYGNGKLVKASDLSLGPQPCNPDPSSSGVTVVFTVGLQECGNIPEMTTDLLTYHTFLTYKPLSASNVPITRTGVAVIPIYCHYPRHSNVSSEAVHPTWIPFTSTVTYEEKMNFSLRLMNGDWSGPSFSSVFALGDPLNIEASVDAANHVPMRLLVDRCVGTLNYDITQQPSYDIIALNGCLIDGKQEDSSSSFRTPRSQPNQIHFTVDAFKFISVDSPVIFITCYLRAIPADAPADSINKACSYSKTRNSWFAVEGPSSICSCCELGRCDPTTSQSRRLSLSRGPSRHWKREAISDAESQDEEWLATLGPLYIVGADGNKALQTTGPSQAMEIWMVTGVGSLWIVVLLAGILVWRIKPKKTPIVAAQ